MKTISTKLSVAIALALAAPFAQAAFLFETAAPVPAPLAAPVARDGRHVVAISAPAPATGRNVDTSANVDRLAKSNRQRIDLESRLSSRITQSGDTPQELAIVRGIGRDVTFEDALRQVLPSGWSAFSDQDLPLAKKVNWSGNRTWPMVVHGLLADHDMRAHVDWKNQEIMFFVPVPKEELTMPVAPGAQGVEVRAVPATAASGPAVDDSAAVKQAGAAAAAVTPVPTATPVTAVLAAPVLTPKVEVREVVWTLSAEFTLRENLRRWASAANWNLVWNAVSGDTVIDYPVDAKVEFNGELLGSSGAMAKVITAYRDADYPLEIEFFRGNRVVEVRLHRIPDSKGTPGDASPTSPPREPLPVKPAPSEQVSAYRSNGSR